MDGHPFLTDKWPLRSLEIYFCDATTDFIVFNDEYIAKAVRNNIHKGVQGMQNACRERNKSSELEQTMKYVGFQAHHGEQYNGEHSH